LIVRPVLCHLELWSVAAENLLLGTAVQESGLRFLQQRGGGPARGVYQIEPRTESDLHDNFLKYRPPLRDKVLALLAPVPSRHEQLVSNLAYATAVARLIYHRIPQQLPEAEDVDALGRYWKRHFNTDAGRGTVSAFVHNYKEFVP
jgi:hypothetical protein